MYGPLVLGSHSYRGSSPHLVHVHLRLTETALRIFSCCNISRVISCLASREELMLKFDFDFAVCKDSARTIAALASSNRTVSPASTDVQRHVEASAHAGDLFCRFGLGSP